MKPNKHNPYSNKRTLPVGDLDYTLSSKLNIWRRAALEYGEAKFIFDIPRLVGGGRLLNLGDLQGGSAILLAQGLKMRGLLGEVMTVDCYSENCAKASQRNMQIAEVDHLITIHRMRTDEFVLTQPVKFVFIDADHHYESVKNDWERFSPWVEEGGMVAFHDTNNDEVDKVIQSINTLNEWEWKFWVNRIKAYVKK